MRREEERVEYMKESQCSMIQLLCIHSKSGITADNHSCHAVIEKHTIIQHIIYTINTVMHLIL